MNFFCPECPCKEFTFERCNLTFYISNCNTGIIMLKILLPEDQVEDP